MADTVQVLFELGTEELPPKALPTLSEGLTRGFAAGLEAASVEFDDIVTYATPRRLAVAVAGCQSRQPDREIEKRGPPVSGAFDADGNPLPAALGFARSCGVSVDELETLETDKGAWLVSRTVERGRTIVEVLPSLAEAAVQGLPIPKRMRWGDSEAFFVRPVHWMVFLAGDVVVPCRMFGVESGRCTRGHRFHHPHEICLGSADEYERELRETGCVEPLFEARIQTIREQVSRIAQDFGGVTGNDRSLFEEVAALTEWPSAVGATFDAEFLEVPTELLVLTMTGDQRYFPVFDDAGNLSNHFVAVANIESRDPEVVRKGNERVIRPRFADAKFFWDRDKESKLEERLPRLKDMVFQKQLGSLYDKTERVAALAADLALLAGTNTDLATRAARLSRCDLVTQTVFEFPEMQGTMGGHLLRGEGEGPELATAVEEFYRPRFAGDALPQTRTGLIVSLADKIDTLIGIFAIGKAPSGDRDPFALRRSALGVLRILKEHKLRVQLRTALEIAHNRLPETVRKNDTVEAVYAFLLDRLRGIYADEGTEPGVFNAVSKVDPSTIEDFDRRVHAVSQFKRMEEAESLAEAVKRIGNILRKSGYEGPDKIDPRLFTEDAESSLHETMGASARQIEPLLEIADYDATLTQLAKLKQPIDRFFDDVMVMVDDRRIRENRLSLLSGLERLMSQVADIAELQISTRQS